MIINKKTIEPLFSKALLLATCSIALFPAIPLLLNSVLIIIWICITIAYRFIYKCNSRLDLLKAEKRLRVFLIYSGNFFLFLISLSYSSDIKRGLSNLETELPMLIFPLVFFLLPFPLLIDRAFLYKILNTFFFSTILFSIWVLYHYWSINLFDEFSKASSLNTIFRESAEQLTGKHPTYLSVYIAFSMIIAINNLFHSEKKYIKIMSSVSLPILIFLLLILASRTPIIAVVVSLLFYSMMQLKRLWLKIVISISVLISFLLLVRFTPAIYSRVEETLNTSFTSPKGKEHNSTNIRAGIYSCSWQLIREKLWVGYGLGSDKKVLNQCYSQYDTDVYAKGAYNTHNQYLNFALLTGLIGLLIFLFSLFSAFRISRILDDHLFFTFLLLCSICFLTENLLSRQSGVVFYYFFLCLFISSLLGEKDRGSRALLGSY